MLFFGLHILDAAILLVYLIGMLYIGKKLSEKVDGQSDFYLAGRKLGKFTQFALNFGSKTDANGAVAISSEVYRSGIGGIWIGLQTLFMTPFYWFTAVWFRRARLITVAELLEERLGGTSLARLYAIFNILKTLLVIGLGYMISYKTMQAMMIKPDETLTAAEVQSIADHERFMDLDQIYKAGTLAEGETEEYLLLKDRKDAGAIQPFVSYIEPLPFYLFYATIVGAYIIMGGFSAAVVTDVFQAIMIIIFSIILIPLGLMELGGISGLREKVPEAMFQLFGGADYSEYSILSIGMILLLGLIGVSGMPSSMAVSGSAKNEYAARMGAVSGGFSKRLMILCWAFCGLIAFGLYSQTLSNPDLAWGTLTQGLLFPGLIGCMLAGILSANMSTLDALTINTSALFVRNLYKPTRPKKSEEHYVLVGRITIGVILAAGVLIAFYMQSIIAVIKIALSLQVVFGAPILLGFFWRRLTRTAVIAQVIICLVLFLFLPLVLPLFSSVKANPELTVKTVEQQRLVIDQAASTSAGQEITKNVPVPARPCFFEKVTTAEDGTLTGSGRFQIEIYIAHLLGFEVRQFTPSELLATRFAANIIVPFILLFGISFLTRKPDPELLDRFFVKQKTPIADTLEEDAIEIEKSYANPRRFDHHKLFPKSSWEFCKWTSEDTLGFLACWGFVAVFLASLILLLRGMA